MDLETPSASEAEFSQFSIRDQAGNLSTPKFDRTFRHTRQSDQGSSDCRFAASAFPDKTKGLAGVHA
jgi:hypothetical protein